MDSEAKQAFDWRVKLGARAMARDIELELRRKEARARPRPDHVDLLAADDFRDADSGRHELAPAPTTVHVGRYLRRARRYARKTQQQIAHQAGVSQSMVSRAERGVAPAMGFERFVLMCQALGRLFPLGVCPHDHECAWQPIKPPDRHVSDAQLFLEYLLKTAGDG